MGVRGRVRDARDARDQIVMQAERRQLRQIPELGREIAGDSIAVEVQLIG